MTREDFLAHWLDNLEFEQTRVLNYKKYSEQLSKEAKEQFGVDLDNFINEVIDDFVNKFARLYSLTTKNFRINTKELASFLLGETDTITILNSLYMQIINNLQELSEFYSLTECKISNINYNKSITAQAINCYSLHTGLDIPLVHNVKDGVISCIDGFLDVKSDKDYVYLKFSRS